MRTLFFILALCTGFAFVSPDLNTSAEVDYVSFTLRNESMKSIPLKIPGVMNPNLSPVSNSGVSLKIGQKILFSYKGRKRLLLSVTKDLEGQIILVNKLIKKRKAEIDLE